MILKTKLFGKVYEFKSLREVMAKANEEKSGDKLAGMRVIPLIIPEEKLHPPAKLAENTFVEHGKAPVVDIAADQPPEWADRPKAENAPETLQSEAVLEYAEKQGKTLSNYDAVVIAQVVEAQKGSTRAAEFVRDSVGDKPGEKVDFTGNMSDADRRMLETVCNRLGIAID